VEVEENTDDKPMGIATDSSQNIRFDKISPN